MLYKAHVTLLLIYSKAWIAGVTIKSLPTISKLYCDFMNLISDSYKVFIIHIKDAAFLVIY